MSKYEFKWWFTLFIMAILIVGIACIICGCEDTTPPEMNYLDPPKVEPMGFPGLYPARLDVWELDGYGYPNYAAFGWEMAFCWTGTEDAFTEPGIHTVFSAGKIATPYGGPVLLKSVRSSGAVDGDPESVTAVSDTDGITRFYVMLHDWPGMWIENHLQVGWNVCGMDGASFASQVNFRQLGGTFFEKAGAYELSIQGWPVPVGDYRKSMAPMDLNMPMKLNPTEPLPRVLVDDILPALAECAFSEDYPPYRDPNATGEGILINVRWFKVKVADGQWQLSPALFITPLPYGRDDVTSIAETAWPYTVCFHAPGESEGLGTVDAKLSIVDPNGVLLTTIGIQIHEVGRCMNCDGRVWRSDYILPLVSADATGRLEVSNTPIPVLIAWLPRGHTMKIEPVIGARELSLLTAYWLLEGESVLNINGDRIVNFKDYAAFRR